MTAFRVEIAEHQITRRLTELLKAGENLTPAMRAVSGLLADLTEEAFARQAQPGGPKWAPLARSTIEGRAGRWAKAKGGTRKDGRISKTVGNRIAAAKLLQDTGRLAASVHGASGADFAQIGVSAVYAAIHQFGGKTSPSVIRPKLAKALTIGDAVVKSANHPGSTIPARPYLPLAGDSKQLTAPAYEGILGILSRHFGV